MSDTALIPFSAGKPPQIAGALAGLGSNIQDKLNVPSLGIKGKVWSISKNGTTQNLMRRDDDGEEIPVSVFKAVILDCAPSRGRAFYEGAYDPNNTAAPRCWSDDGKVPSKGVTSPVASACDQCPNSVKGSKVNDSGQAGVACAAHRMVALVPAAKLDFTPLRLKLAITSIWDSQSPEMEAQGWYSFDKYLDFLKANGCPHTAAVVTKMRFDSNVAYPKIFFSADSWLTEAQQTFVAGKIHTPEVQQLIDGSWTPAGVDGVKVAEDAPAKVAARPAPEPEPEPEPEPAPAIKAAATDDDGDTVNWDNMGAEVLSPDEPATATKPARAAKAKPAPKAEAVPEVSTNVPEGLEALLEGWGN